MKVRDWAGIELTTPGSAVRHTSVTRHVNDCATRPGQQQSKKGGKDQELLQSSTTPVPRFQMGK